MRIEAKVIGDKALSAKLGFLSREMKNPRPLFQSLGIEAHKWILKNMRASGGMLKGSKWKPLAPLTVQSRRKGSDRPLLDTGGLMRGWSWSATGRRAIVGHGSDIALFHNEGTKPYIIRPRHKKVLWFGVTPAQRRKKAAGGIFARVVHHPGLPQRRMIPTEDEVGPALNKTADAWLGKVIKKAGL